MTVAPAALESPRRVRRVPGLARFVLRRLGALVLLTLGITAVAFVLTQLVPSNAVATNLGEQAAGDPAAVAAFKHHYGLDRPFPVRYAIYLDHLVHGDLGQSTVTHGPVTHDLGQFIPATAELALYSILFASVVGIAFNVSLLTRFTRSAVLEVIGNDYVRAARAKGLPERTVVVRYIVRGALPSVVTVLGLVFANVLTGAVLVEKIFSWPGIGQYAFQAAVNVDVPAIAGVSLFVAVVYITVNFVVDILYGLIDPRIRVT